MTLTALDAGQLGELRGELDALYRSCFTEPPWSEPPDRLDQYLALLDKRLARPGMSGVIARDESTVVGVVYGAPTPATLPDEPFYHALADQLPVHGLVSPALEVIELMVHPARRGRGLGRALLDRYVAGHDAAWLCTHPDAPARRLYESANWKLRGTFSYKDQPRVVYTWTAEPAPSTGSTARTAVPEPSLR